MPSIDSVMQCMACCVMISDQDALRNFMFILFTPTPILRNKLSANDLYLIASTLISFLFLFLCIAVEEVAVESATEEPAQE